MDTLGERLNYARKSNGYTQNSLAESIGVSRGVIFNLEKNKTVPQAIVINAICRALNVNSEWLMNGVGEMRKGEDPARSDKVLRELYEFASELSEDEQLYLLDAAKALKHRLKRG
ncbi:MAG: helix-turn-helix domain-containing protein [Acetatifactor sp.]|nr:helix-turn-helix domain-containing protein [Acetatifactor sp.]MDE7045269.1 helix-turn-helix domain-containing protein [Acetatifactor sp.]